MNIDKYRSYSLEAFLEDREFRKWVKHPNEKSDRFWKSFLKHYPQQETTLKQARHLLLQMNRYFETADQSTTGDAEDFRKELLQTMKLSKARKRGKPRKLLFTRRIAIAASIAFALGILSWFWQGQGDNLQTIATDFEEWKTIPLPDGSTVKLNAHSELKFAKDWEEGADRIVWLKGEAFFEVEKKPATGAKFQVITADLTIEVLGTSFNVLNRRDQTDVFLEEGRIKINLGEQEAYLDPGDFIAYSARKKAITKQYKATAEKHISWKDGTLILKDTPTIEILNKIEEIYGVAIKYENEAIRSQLKTVMVPMDKLEIAIPILEKTLNIEIIKTANQLIIK